MALGVPAFFAPTNGEDLPAKDYGKFIPGRSTKEKI
jgi:hypothetical protein